jgi:prevent-host-death family protein
MKTSLRTMDAMRSISVTEFRAKCYRILDEVAESGEPVLITRRGRPLAILCPVGGKAK